jgi:DNA-binding NarL/FixJ family response regulator
LIVLDIGLPKLNGLEAANRILGIGHNSAKIIFLTQESDSDVVQAAFSAEAQRICPQNRCRKSAYAHYQSRSSREKFVSWHKVQAGLRRITIAYPKSAQFGFRN